MIDLLVKMTDLKLGFDRSSTVSKVKY